MIAVGHVAQFDKVVMHHPELPELSLAGTPFEDGRHDITYHAQWSNRSPPRTPVSEQDMYCTFVDLAVSKRSAVGSALLPTTAQNSDVSWRPAIAKAWCSRTAS